MRGVLCDSFTDKFRHLTKSSVDDTIIYCQDVYVFGGRTCVLLFTNMMFSFVLYVDTFLIKSNKYVFELVGYFENIYLPIYKRNTLEFVDDVCILC